MFFNRSPFWLRLFDFLLSLMNEGFTKFVGNKIGAFMEVTKDREGSCIGKFMRMRVNMDIRRPLQRVFRINHHGVSLVLPIKYERLPDYCSYCGLVGHVEDVCEARLMLENPQKATYLFNSLRATGSNSPFQSSRQPPSSPEREQQSRKPPSQHDEGLGRQKRTHLTEPPPNLQIVPTLVVIPAELTNLLVNFFNAVITQNKQAEHTENNPPSSPLLSPHSSHQGRTLMIIWY